jgi:SulP family sulfate permease
VSFLPARLLPALATLPPYRGRAPLADLAAGATVAVVALPLSMAIAMASGLPPGAGLVTAIVGGFLVSALGGSLHQIGGPAGAFIVLVAACVHEHGAGGLATATLMSGLMLALLGIARAGGLVRRIPHPVTVGFMAGIAVIIAASQIAPLLGLHPTQEPPELAEKLPVLWAALPGANPWAAAVAGLTIAVVIVCRRLAPRSPALLAGVAVATVAVLPGLPVDTIGSRFGAMPAGIPWPALPDLSVSAMLAVLPDALAFTLLGAIESLLSATVADRMAGTQHRPDAELVGQGVANVAVALVGGFAVTGTIARTATNVRAGGQTPVAGMWHAVILWLILVAAGPLALHIPLPALAAVLMLVAWGMVERHEITGASRGEGAVIAVTLGLTLAIDLVAGIVGGCALAAILAAARRRGSGSPGDRAPP